MAWRTLTEADILTGLNGPETAAYKQAALKAGQADPLQEIIIQVTNEARGHIADCAKNRLADGVTLPERIIIHAVAIVRYRMATRLGVSVKDEREVEFKEARRFLERVSECKVRIELPEGAVEDDGSNETIEVVSNGGRNATREILKGL